VIDKEMARRVYGTHITRADSYVGHIEVIWSSEAAARTHAMRCSTHPGVLHASVTVFTLDELGTRHPLVWYRHGKENLNGRPFVTGRYGPVISRHDRNDPH
jgi:hypothetical protein